MEFLISLPLGVISGVIASYLFLNWYLNKMKPVIHISPFISNVEHLGEESYFFKFVNRTNSEIFDVHIECTFHKPVGDFKGRNLMGTDVLLKDNFASYIPSESCSDLFNLHARRLRTTQNLLKDWKDDSSFIRLTIIAKHSLSGMNRVFYRDFNSVDCITTKKFISGNDLGVR